MRQIALPSDRRYVNGITFQQTFLEDIFLLLVLRCKELNMHARPLFSSLLHRVYASDSNPLSLNVKMAPCSVSLSAVCYHKFTTDAAHVSILYCLLNST